MIDIYCVENDENISQMVQESLEQRGYKVSVFRTIAEVKMALKESCPTLALVSGNMPDGDGGALCRWIRSEWENLPVIFLFSRELSGEGASVLQNGADECLPKPFEPEVLFSRILSLLRRTGDVSMQYLSCGNILLDQKRMLVFNGTEEVSLNSQEYRLLLFLLQNKGKTVMRGKLLEKVWDIRGDCPDNNVLTVTMKRLREKLDKPAGLKTVRGIGYRLEE